MAMKSELMGDLPAPILHDQGRRHAIQIVVNYVGI